LPRRLRSPPVLLGALPLGAQEEPKGSPSPGEIVTAAPKADWVAIPAEDLLVMTLAPDAEGKPRQVVIQLMPAPFSQGWVHNIRLFARSGWYDGISVNRVQDNYVTQWGDPNYDNPEATGKPKPLPDGLKVMGEEHTATSPCEPQRDRTVWHKTARETTPMRRASWPQQWMADCLERRFPQLGPPTATVWSAWGAITRPTPDQAPSFTP
jgi:hypothetical protein